MTFRLAQYGRAFTTRPRGVELLHEVERQADTDDLVVVDFDGVLAVSYSFADEFVGRLFERQSAGDLPFAVRLANVAPDIQRVVAATLDRRGVASTV